MSDVLSEMLAGVETVGTSDAADIEVDCVVGLGGTGEVEALRGWESTCSGISLPNVETIRQIITIEVRIILLPVCVNGGAGG